MSDEKTLFRYSVTSIKGEGWAIAFVDCASGCFSALSDWGDVAYRWNLAGVPAGTDFRRFLVDLDGYYLTEKLSGGAREYDAEATLREARMAIAALEDEEARAEEEALLKDCNELRQELDVGLWMERGTSLDASDIYRSRRPLHVTHFVSFAWPRLKAAILAELEG